MFYLRSRQTNRTPKCVIKLGLGKSHRYRGQAVPTTFIGEGTRAFHATSRHLNGLSSRYSPFQDASDMALAFSPLDKRTENTSIVTKGITAQLLSPKTLLQTDPANDARCSITHSTVLQWEVFKSLGYLNPTVPLRLVLPHSVGKIDVIKTTLHYPSGRYVINSPQ